MKLGSQNKDNNDVLFLLDQKPGGWIPEELAPKGILALANTTGSGPGHCVYVDDCSPYGSDCHPNSDDCVTGQFCLTIGGEACDDCCQPGKKKSEFDSYGSGADGWLVGGTCGASSPGMIESQVIWGGCNFYVCLPEGSNSGIGGDGTYNRCYKQLNTYQNVTRWLGYDRYNTEAECCSACKCATTGACCDCSRTDGLTCTQTTLAECNPKTPGETATWRGLGTKCSECPSCPPDPDAPGACCNCETAPYGCTQAKSEDCKSPSVFKGPGTSCSPDPCDCKLGACCDCESTGGADGCLGEMKESDCTASGTGTWKGSGTTCDDCAEGCLGRCTYVYYYAGGLQQQRICTVTTDADCQVQANLATYLASPATGNADYEWEKCPSSDNCKDFACETDEPSANCAEITSINGTLRSSFDGCDSRYPPGWFNATTKYECHRLESGSYYTTVRILATCPAGSTMVNFQNTDSGRCYCRDANGDFSTPIPPAPFQQPT